MDSKCKVGGCARVRAFVCCLRAWQDLFTSWHPPALKQSPGMARKSSERGKGKAQREYGKTWLLKHFPRFSIPLSLAICVSQRQKGSD